MRGNGRRWWSYCGRRRLVPFLDLAYQGFALDLEADAAGLRLVAEQVPESLVAVSYSKNLGLYRERVGALIVIGENESRADAMLSHVLQIARGIYSMPPDHGAAIAAHIFTEPRAQRAVDPGARRGCGLGLADMRGLLALELRKADGRWFIRLHSNPARNVLACWAFPRKWWSGCATSITST